ncbi:hypothetical protein NEOC84_000611|uniref:DUF294 nucleotidyltransferase-like domain-containing protein n=1 Tax=Neochlamydia sp. AcF84 TaxID=2315858 RepID=UPI00140A206D|nr:DUF294 nucleotidyltransferase-like domain-containing protein [Neochlamydia sp. AcF84]NGY94720.1 hypothetical protein [Neochlamydia sp. AcF84]
MSLDNLCMHACIFPAFKNIKNEALNHERTDPPYIEIFFKIFEKLGLQDWCRAKQVCKEWKQVVEKHPLAENIYRLALRHVTQKDGPLQEVVDTKKLAQEVGCIEKLGDIYAEKGTSKALLQAAGLYNYARRLSSADKQEITKEKLLTVHDLLAQLCKGKHLDEALITKEFKSNRLALRSHRRRIKKKIRSLPDTPSPQQVRELYRGIAQRIKSFFSFLVDQAIDVLGPAPCEYAMIGFGSLAREEMTPYSDLEFGILIKEDSDVNKKYFRNLTNLIHLKVINLGETILPALNIPCIKEANLFDSVTPRGFAFDGEGAEGKGCKTPFGNRQTFELIQTPEKMAQYIAQDKDEEWWHEKERHLPMELLTFTHLLGTEELTEQYR